MSRSGSGGSGLTRRGRLLTLWVATGVLVGAGLVVSAHRVAEAACGGRVSVTRNASSPLLAPDVLGSRPDQHRDRLVAAVGRMGPPFGPLVGAVDYDYQQWLHLYGVQGGVLAWTRGDAPVTLLTGPTLRPAWAIRPATSRTAWDASGNDFLLLSLSSGQDTQVQRFDLAAGTSRWCTRLDTRNRPGDVLVTAVLADHGVVVAAAEGPGIEVTRLAGSDGARDWRRVFTTVDRADFVGQVSDDLVVVGGREEFHLADGAFSAPKGPSLTAIRLSDGKPAWTWTAPPGGVVHVVGQAGDRLVLLEHDPRATRLLGLDLTGKVAWTVLPPAGALQSTLRDGVVVMKGTGILLGFDAATGERLWDWPVPTDRTFIPYGFTLGQMPSLDSGHLLMPTTTDLRSLDVRTGFVRIFRMPTDGIRTTYWPYQLLATDQVIGVVTNTGAVVVRRNAGKAAS